MGTNCHGSVNKTAQINLPVLLTFKTFLLPGIHISDDVFKAGEKLGYLRIRIVRTKGQISEHYQIYWKYHISDLAKKPKNTMLKTCIYIKVTGL